MVQLVMRRKLLKPQHKIFARMIRAMRVQETGAVKHPYDAYLIAFPSCKSKRAAQVGACRLLKRPDIDLYLSKHNRQMEAVELNHKLVNSQRILDEEAKLGFLNVADMLDENGVTLDIADMPEEIQRAISDIEYGLDIATGTRYIKKVKLYNKGQALDRMEKILGMQRDVVEIDLVAQIKAMILSFDGKQRDVLPQESG